VDLCVLLYRYKDDKPITDGKGTFEVEEKDPQYLISESVDKVDNGTYSCRVSDGVNEIRKEIKLYILRKFVLTLFALGLRCVSVINSRVIYQI
jgi:hypothetical protein